MIERRSVPENKHYVAVKAADLYRLEAEIERLRAEVASLKLALENSSTRHEYTAPPGMVFVPEDFLTERDRLREEVAAKEKFVKDAIAACSNAGRLRELLRQCRSIAALESFTAEYTREKVASLLAQIDAALGGEKS